MIEALHLTKRYADTLVVDDVSLRIAAGGMTVIIGPNGAGKSTLLSMISRLLPMSAGEARVDGMDVRHCDTTELAKRLAILKQDNHVALRLTVRELVAFGRFPHSRGRLSAEDQRHIDDALRYLGLEALQERFLDQLSGGQRQRAFVAMVLCQQTDYVLLDEPLNGLDMRHAVAMMATLRQACDELGKTVVMVLHDINFASCYADTIVAMRDGKVVCHGPPAELITADTLTDLYGTPVRVQEIDGQRICVYYSA